MSDDSPDRSASSASDPLFVIGRALEHPIRVRILKALMHGSSASASDLSKSWGEHLGSVAYHMKVLRDDLSLLVVVARHRKRGANETVVALSSGFPSGVLMALISMVEARASGSNGGESQCVWESVTVDERGARAIGEAFREGAAVVNAERRRCAESARGPLIRLGLASAVCPADPSFPVSGR